MKRIFSLLAAFLIAAALLSVSAFASSDVTLKIEADKTQAEPGEEITYTISVENGTGSGVAGLSFDVAIPSCMEYVSSSVQCGGSGMYSLASYNSDTGSFAGTGADTLEGITDTNWSVMTLTCRVKDDAGTGDSTLSLGNVLVYDGELTDLAYSYAFQTVNIQGDPQVTIEEEPVATPVPVDATQAPDAEQTQTQAEEETAQDETEAVAQAQEQAEAGESAETAAETQSQAQETTAVRQLTGNRSMLWIVLVLAAALVCAVVIIVASIGKKGKHQ